MQDKVGDHIKSFPTMEPHYNRRDSTKKYLEQPLNIQKMYDVYFDECDLNNAPKVKKHMHR